MSERGPGSLLAQVEIRDRTEDADCVAENGTFCFGWVAENIDRYVAPTLEHLVLVGVSVSAGFLIAFSLAYLSHRRRFLQPGFTAATGILYTIPSVAFFVLLLPVMGRGTATGIVALTAYALQIIYRNMATGLANVPEAAKEAGRGMGMTPNQLFWRVELPLSVPEIVAGMRIATVSTVAIATLAFLGGAGGLGVEIFTQIDFKTNVIITSLICVGMALIFDVLLLMLQALLAPWRRTDRPSRKRRMPAIPMPRRSAA